MNMPNDYPSRKSIQVDKDQLDPLGKGPKGENMSGNLAPVDTTGFVHRQDIAPNAEGTPSIPTA